MTGTLEANKSVGRRVFTGKVVGSEGCAGMRRALPLSGYALGLLLACSGLGAQTVPQATDLPSRPFFIKTTWYIGGAGNWDYLTMDPQADRLYIAHGTQMQVVDVETGSLAGALDGFYEVRQIVLDDTGQLGFISDGGQGKVAIFDRQTLKKVTEIEVGANPRSMVYDPLTRLLFVVRANPPPEGANTPAGRGRTASREAQPGASAAAATPAETHSVVTVIDTQAQAAIGEIEMPGLLGYAVGDSTGEVFVGVTDRNAVYRLDAQEVATLMHASTVQGGATPAAGAKKEPAPWVALDWVGDARRGNAAQEHVRILPLGPDCTNPAGLALDSAHLRLFAACVNRRLVVLNTGTGERVTSLPIGPGVEAVGYDSERGLIFTANGAAEGSVTIIRQDVTDSYAVIQTLPTRQRASTLAVNPASGAVYLVTDYLGVDLNKPGGIGTLETVPVTGSFQVLTVGN
jgi:hypothetical protein